MELTRTPIQVPSLTDFIRICRPHQWTKNVFVLAPLLFSESIGKPEALLHAGLAFLCFCFWSSSVYCLNDLLDAEADRVHPRKCKRPIPSGRVAPWMAIALGLGLAVSASAIAILTLPPLFLVFGLVYLANSVLYCLLLKHRVIVDVLSIAIGFVLRLLAGCAAITVVPTSWILVCGFSLAMLLGFGKRRLDGPVEVLLKDPIFALNGLLWLATIVAVLYVLPATGAITP
jgi:4-hydroxybenzoate polyprenyltransferase